MELTTYFMVIGGVTGAIVFVLAMVRLKFAIMIAGGLLLAASIASGYDPVFNPQRTWLDPIALQRTPIFGILGAALFVVTLIHVGKLRLERIAPQCLSLIAIGCFAGFVRMISGNIDDGLLSIGLAGATILPLGLILPAILSEEGGYFRVLRWIGIIAAIWTFAVVIQFGINPNALSRGGFGALRFQGMLANAQHTGSYLAPTFVTLLCLYLHDPKKRFRLFWLGLLALVGMMVLWTGSRSAFGLSVIGSSFVLVSRMGRTVLFAPVAVVIILVGLQLLEAMGVEILYGRLVSTEDTRSQAWGSLWQQFLENPVLGTTGSGELGQFSENSYLLGMAQFGIGMGLILFAYMALSAAQCWKLFRVRSRFTPRGKALVDLVLAFHFIYFAGGMTEGYIMSRVSTMLVMMTIFGSMASCLIADAKAAGDVVHDEAGEHEEGETGESEWTEYGDEDPGASRHPAVA